MTTSTEGRSFVWGVFDADGCECQSLSAVFETEAQAANFAARLNSSAQAEYDELYRDKKWRPSIKRIISVRALELGLEPDLDSTLLLLRANREEKGCTKSDQI